MTAQLLKTAYGSIWHQEDILQDPVASVVVVHGYAEHSGRYDELTTYLLKAGIQVGRFDFTGHGNSTYIGGRKGYIHSFLEYRSDLKLYWNYFVKHYAKGKPVFLLSQSLGGLVSAYFICDAEYDEHLAGSVFCSPALKVSEDLSPFLQRISGVLSLLFPRVPTVRLDSSMLSRDEEVVMRYDEDPKNYRGGIYARTGHQILRATKAVRQCLPAISLPLLILHGSQDQIAHPSGSRMLEDEASSTDKQLIIYEGLYHELFREPEHQKVLTDITEWITTRAMQSNGRLTHTTNS